MTTLHDRMEAAITRAASEHDYGCGHLGLMIELVACLRGVSAELDAKRSENTDTMNRIIERDLLVAQLRRVLAIYAQLGNPEFIKQLVESKRFFDDGGVGKTLADLVTEIGDDR
jgi:hypothetical protein